MGWENRTQCKYYIILGHGFLENNFENADYAVYTVQKH